MKVVILAVLYYEPSYVETLKCISASGVPAYFVDRAGTGSLAEAVNRGAAGLRGWVEQAGLAIEAVWVLTNVTFEPGALKSLCFAMEAGEYAAVHPAFNSDHKHLQQNGSGGFKAVPFVEFTAPLVRPSVLTDFPLDEAMPYVGHDMDWGYRVRQAGHKVGVCYGAKLGHAYIRHAARNPVTDKRAALRKSAVEATTKALVAKHGPQWREKLSYGGAL